MLAALLLCAGLSAAQVESVKPPELPAAAALPGSAFILPALPALALPAEVAGQPVASFAPPGRDSAGKILGALAGAIRDAARAHGSPAAVLESFWSGRGPVVEAAPGASDTVAQRLNRIVAVAETAPTGRAVLARVRKLERPRPVLFAKLGRELGRYDYVTDTLSLDKRFLTADPRLAAATLIHELAHIAQHADGLPAEALELELEAHALDLQLMKELGVPEKARDGFSREALKHLRRGPDRYVAFLRKQLPGKFYLEGRNFSELADAQEDELDRLEESKSAKARALAPWVLRDIKLLRSQAGRKKYLRFSENVAALLERLSRAL